MAKQVIVYFALLALVVVFLIPTQTSAASWCTTTQNCCDESNGGDNGLVPCGRSSIKRYIVTAACQLDLPPFPISTSATRTEIFTATSELDAQNQMRSRYPCPHPAAVMIFTSTLEASDLACRCELYHVFFLLLNVYKFVIWIIAIPLAGIMLGIGGILLLLGGSYPRLHDMGRTIIWGAVWGVALILGAWVIIGFVLMVIGYNMPNMPWFTFPIS